jgi:ferredoxin-NADP reductase
MVTTTQYFTARITSVIDQTLTIRTLLLEIPREYPAFKTGQVIRVWMGKNRQGNPLQEKPYCICSLPEDNVIELCVDRVNEQGVSGMLHQYTLGDHLNISPPMGKFGLHEENLDKSLLFVGFGSGIGVVRGLMRQYYKGHRVHPIQFYAINTDETTIPYEESLERDTEFYPGFELYPVLQTDGYDTDEIFDRLMSHIGKLSDWVIYLAGPAQPVQGLSNMLREHDVVKQNLYAMQYL